jgi:agmatinase
MLESDLKLFTVPEKTAAGYGFADIPVKISLDESEIVIYGIPLDATTSFGKGTSKGPEAIRLTSARQIETFLLDERADIYDFVKIYDLGDLKLEKNKQNTRAILAFIDSSVSRVTSLLRQASKIPVILGGEHTLAYYHLKALADERPLVIHFDAHRDMKPQYEGMQMCHTTPFYHIMEYIKGQDIIQIGIRQTDKEENQIAEENSVTTFDAWQIHDDISLASEHLRRITANRNIYISFDIDVYDLPYVPCTGTPEPFGLNPFQVQSLLKSIDSSAKLVGMDMVEVGLKNGDYREGTLATETLLRILCREYVSKAKK